MREETEFWGIGTPEAWEGNPLLSFTGNAPDQKPFRVYPVFDSREKAEKFVKEHYDPGTGDVKDTPERDTLVDKIRKIESNELPPDHDVSFNGGEPVKWSVLMADDVPSDSTAC